MNTRYRTFLWFLFFVFGYILTFFLLDYISGANEIYGDRYDITNAASRAFMFKVVIIICVLEIGLIVLILKNIRLEKSKKSTLPSGQSKGFLHFLHTPFVKAFIIFAIPVILIFLQVLIGLEG